MDFSNVVVDFMAIGPVAMLDFVHVDSPEVACYVPNVVVLVVSKLWTIMFARILYQDDLIFGLF